MWLATKTGDPRQDCAPIRHCATRGCVNEAEERRESGNCRYCGRCFEIITNISRFKKVNVRSGEKMDGSRKNDDCYFYYYSTCSKGDSCLFRHEENALGCEIVCQYWKEGKCMNGRCNYRHMELKKNRKAIPCYWETQPSGCRKPHCPFLHLNEKEKPPDNKSKDSVPVVGAMANIPGGVMKGMPLDGSHPSDGNLRRVAGNPPGGELTYSSPPVDPLVVKFEEESDNETESPSPRKFISGRTSGTSWVKTLEEIKLERIGKQSAAFYGMNDDYDVDDIVLDKDRKEEAVVDRRANANKRLRYDENSDEESQTTKRRKTKTRSRTSSVASEEVSKDLGFKVLTLEEIRRNRARRKLLPEAQELTEAEPEPDSTSRETVQPAVSKETSPELSGDTTKADDEKPRETSTDDESPSAINANSKEDAGTADVPHHKQKPIRLRRCLKRKSDEENVAAVERKLSSGIKRLKVAEEPSNRNDNGKEVRADNLVNDAKQPLTPLEQHDTIDILNGINEFLTDDSEADA